MAIKTIFINFIVPISKIEEKYPWWFDKCLEDHKEYLGGKVYYDNYLFRDWAMNSNDMKDILDYWEWLGFTTLINNNWEYKREEVCIYENYSESYKCDWLDIWEKENKNFVFLKHTIPWAIIW